MTARRRLLAVGAALKQDRRACDRRAPGSLKGERMDVQVVGDVTVVTLPARVDTTSARDVEAGFNEQLDGGARNLVADFGDNEYVSSAGLRVFLAVLKFLEKNEGRIVLCAMQPFVEDVFQISGFSELFSITSTREEAIALFA